MVAVLGRRASMGKGVDRDVKVGFQKFGGEFIKKKKKKKLFRPKQFQL